jgi:hypothetical protein
MKTCKPIVIALLLASPAAQAEIPAAVATLNENGKTVGRHYAGPSWEPAAGATDIPLLKLEVTERRGNGGIAGTTTIQRINTTGGVAEGACPTAGALLAVPYSADYAFLRK